MKRYSIPFAIIACLLIHPTREVRAQSRWLGYAWTCSLDNLDNNLTLCQHAYEPQLALYVTDAVAQSVTSVAGLFILQYGTGTNCATGTVSLFPSAAAVQRYVYPSNALYAGSYNFQTPLRVPPGNDLCVLCQDVKGQDPNPCVIQINGQAAY